MSETMAKSAEEVQQEAVETFQKTQAQIIEEIKMLSKTDAGRRLVELLKRRTIDMPSWGTNMGETPFIYYREGQNQLVRELIDLSNS